MPSRLKRKDEKFSSKVKHFKCKVKAAEKVREKEKKFKSRKEEEEEGPVGSANGLPIIDVLCNPGLRLRHWQKVSLLLYLRQRRFLYCVNYNLLG